MFFVLFLSIIAMNFVYIVTQTDGWSLPPCTMFSRWKARKPIVFTNFACKYDGSRSLYRMPI